LKNLITVYNYSLKSNCVDCPLVGYPFTTSQRGKNSFEQSTAFLTACVFPRWRGYSPPCPWLRIPVTSTALYS